VRFTILLALVGCVEPAPVRNLALDAVTFFAPKAECRGLKDHTAVCRLPDGAGLHCSYTDRLVCEQMNKTP
jgi:hypothetical protein